MIYDKCSLYFCKRLFIKYDIVLTVFLELLRWSVLGRWNVVINTHPVFITITITIVEIFAHTKKESHILTYDGINSAI